MILRCSCGGIANLICDDYTNGFDDPFYFVECSWCGASTPQSKDIEEVKRAWNAMVEAMNVSKSN